MQSRCHGLSAIRIKRQPASLRTVPVSVEMLSGESGRSNIGNILTLAMLRPELADNLIALRSVVETAQAIIPPVCGCDMAIADWERVALRAILEHGKSILLKLLKEME